MNKIVVTICGETITLMSDEDRELLAEAAQRLEDHVRTLGASISGDQRKKMFVCAALAFSLEVLKYERHCQILSENVSSAILSDKTISCT
ncbi:MAG: hypothetical protein UU47_C0003G0061 [candidate division TM6 bacterium GW2011_GWE2_41_16]|nr:MAG: hypothetical protein UU47_C0003G0061 [candidate division TM6 bacterium GW2011_GWE2_41_16]